MSDAALRRITSDVPLADLAPLALAVESRACDICVSGRKNGVMETEAYRSVQTPRSGGAASDISGGEYRRRSVSGGWDGGMQIERQCRPGREM